MQLPDADRLLGVSHPVTPPVTLPAHCPTLRASARSPQSVDAEHNHSRVYTMRHMCASRYLCGLSPHAQNGGTYGVDVGWRDSVIFSRHGVGVGPCAEAPCARLSLAWTRLPLIAPSSRHLPRLSLHSSFSPLPPAPPLSRPPSIALQHSTMFSLLRTRPGLPAAARQLRFFSGQLALA